MSKVNERKIINKEEKIITDVLYFDVLNHGDLVEFKPTINKHFSNSKLRDKYLSQKDLYDGLQRIYLFVLVELDSNIFEYLEYIKKQNDVIKFTLKYSKLIESKVDLKDKLLAFFNSIFMDEASKYYNAVELFCSGELKQDDTLYNQIKDEDIANE